MYSSVEYASGLRPLRRERVGKDLLGSSAKLLTEDRFFVIHGVLRCLIWRDSDLLGSAPLGRATRVALRATHLFADRLRFALDLISLRSYPRGVRALRRMSADWCFPNRLDQREVE
jgi:hypothetical protein